MMPHNKTFNGNHKKSYDLYTEIKSYDLYTEIIVYRFGRQYELVPNVNWKPSHVAVRCVVCPVSGAQFDTGP